MRAIAEDLGVFLPTAQLLVNRGCTTPAEARSFLAKEEEQLHDPFLMKDMDRAVERIVAAIEGKERIVIYGDYDVDGVTSTTCLTLYLASRGADVGYFIPSRAGEGYGVSEGALRKLAEEGCRLIVTVDTGVTASAEVVLAHELGMDIVITDHHECHEDLPEAEAVVNPRRPDCTYPFKELAGVGVVFKLLCALEAVLSPDDGMMDCVRRVAKEYGDLVAIGTVADVMPIRDENRLIVSYGLSLLENTARPGLVELIEATRMEAKAATRRKITASYIGYTIAPRINAAGRIRDASLAVELLLAKDCDTAAPLARHLCDINRERQEEENKIMEEAYAKIAAEHDFEHDPVIVLSAENWHHGIIGIVASRITEKYGCPSILVSFEGAGEEKKPDDPGKGSGRSVKGLNLVEALVSCSDLLEKYGGHELAAGLTVKRENLAEFKRRLNDYARERLNPAEMMPELDAECELAAPDITLEQASELYSLEPYGVSNPVPVFILRNASVAEITPVGGGRHTRVILRTGGKNVTAMCFRMSTRELDLYPGDEVDVLFTLDVNEFQNQKTVQLIVKDIRLTAERMDAENRERELYELFRTGKTLRGLASAQAVIPAREDFAEVYGLLRRQLSADRDSFTVRALSWLAASEGRPIGYIKLKVILLTFRELGLFGVERLSGEPEIFAFRRIVTRGKVDLTAAAVYRKIMHDFGQD
ncbi:MAG: single-stranded-DNA-specific exonuclease RecJ [Clostridia bacterium]|nr:single-stranded-DNA-specific exonuclease RecJ [Clostridia bacterium]